MDTKLEVATYPTVGQIEREISQRVRKLYRHLFGHQPSKVDCHLLGNKLIISLEDAITPIEKLLVEAQSSSLAIQLRSFIDETIKPKLREIVEEISKVSVVNCLYDTSLDSGIAGAIVILNDPPQTRYPKSQLKKISEKISDR